MRQTISTSRIKKLFTAPGSKFFIACLMMFTFLFSMRAQAQGDLLVTPKRVVFDGSKRSEELNLANVGKDTARFIISFIQIRMKDDGSFEQITQPDSAQYFADKYLRFFPRSVTLAPNEAQTVKIQLTRTNEMKPGEYRSHLYFRATGSDKPLGEKDVQKDSAISVHLTPVFGISIPVIVRQGELNSKVTFSHLSLQMENDRQPVLNITFNRSGNKSIYGDLAVNYVSANGKVTRVGVVKGLAVYTPNTVRNFHVLLDKKQNLDYHSGKLLITYSEQQGQMEKQLAADELILQ